MASATHPTEFKHVVLDDSGTAFVEGTRIKVRLLVLGQIAHGWSAEELQWQHPTLTLAQVHAALAYYYEHQEAMDERTEEELAWLDAQRAANASSPVRRKLARLGYLG